MHFYFYASLMLHMIANLCMQNTKVIYFFLIFPSELCLWDISDGRCIENTKTEKVHSDMLVSIFVSHLFQLIYNIYILGRVNFPT